MARRDYLSSDMLKGVHVLVVDDNRADLTMPRRDGYWLIAQVRGPSTDRGGCVPAIAVIGHDRHTHTPARSRAAGFQAHLYKPVDISRSTRGSSVVRPRLSPDGSRRPRYHDG